MIKTYCTIHEALHTMDDTIWHYEEKDVLLAILTDDETGSTDVFVNLDYVSITLCSFDWNLPEDLEEILYMLIDIKSHYRIQVLQGTIDTVAKRIKELG